MKIAALFLTTLVAMATCDTSLEEFTAGNLKFTASLYNGVLKANPNKNFIFSPISIEIILALTRAGAKNETEQEITKGLYLPNPENTVKALGQLLPSLKSNKDDLKLSSANKMFLGKNFAIKDSFKTQAIDLYKADIENVDFSQNVGAAQAINQWVEQQTNNKIKNLIDPGSLTALTRLVLVNALYFSGKWEIPFETYLTKKEKFFTSNTQSKEVDMMHVEDTFRYYECAKCNAKFLELPYVGGNITMTIVLPNEKEGLSALENNLEEILKPQPLDYQRVAVSFPKFLVESDIKLKPILQNMGLITMFDGRADFSGITHEPLYVDDVIQKAFINTTESGTEAAAATAVYGVLLSASVPSRPPLQFRADRPYLYYIKLQNSILFAGKIRKI